MLPGMNRGLFLHWRWMTALSLASACGDDGATADTDTETDTDVGDDDDDDDDDDDSMTDPDPDSTSSSDGSTSPTEPDSSSDATAESSSSSGGDLCGNGAIDDGEVCDGDELDGSTCESVGEYVGGELTCLDDCSGFDESGCLAMDCGDGQISGDEDCDGFDLGGQACTDLDFDGGTLACSGTCAFDTSACVIFSCGDGEVNDPREECDIDDFGDTPTCGDLGLGDGTLFCTEQCTIETAGCCGSNTVGAGETCDGTDLNGASCASIGQGFDDGALACNATCDDYDTSACTTCGDAVIEGNEQCEGADLAGNDCTTVPGGFVAGTLACDATCGFDTTGCNFCGNDIIDAGEDCDGTAMGTGTCVSLGHTGGTLGCGACTYDETGCTDFPLPGAGELVITEVMQNPLAVDDTLGEYVELHNPSLVESFQLLGCTMEDAGGDSITIETDLVIDAGGYVVLARTDTPGFTPDYVYGPGNGFQLSNTEDEVRIVCAGTTVDEVIYDENLMWPDPTGASMQLDPGSLDTAANDLPENWCESFNDLGNGDLGTPGTANVGCAAPTYNVDFCRLQFPTTIDNVLEGSSVDVYGRIFVAGLTDATAATDPAANVIGYVGYGPDGTDPAVDLTWTWTPATPNAAWMDPGFPGSSEDEYVASLTAPVAGTYDYAYRFTGDGGTTFTYCDTDGTGGGASYEVANAGAMTTVPNGDPTLMYFSEYLESGSNKALEIYNPGPQPVFFDQCVIRRYTNGAAAPSATLDPAVFTEPEDHMIGAGDVLVICGSMITNPQLNLVCDVANGVITHTGDDAYDMVCNGVTIDTFGRIGEDPGTEWTGGGVGTEDVILRRDCAVTAGDPDGSDVFDPSVQWDEFVDNDYTNLGTRGCP